MLSAPVVITPPAGAVIASDEAKAFLRVDGTALDTEIALQIAAAVADLEARTGARLLDQVVEVTADCFAELEHLRVAPIEAVTSITYRDSEGEEQILAAEAYELFGAPFEQGIRGVFGGTWPATDGRSGAIIVRLEVGYGATAADVTAAAPQLRLAAFALLRARFEGTEADIDSLIANHRFWL